MLFQTSLTLLLPAALSILSYPTVNGNPQEYWATTTPAVLAAYRESLSFMTNAMSSSSNSSNSGNPPVNCGKPPKDGSQPMWFTQNGCSLAAYDMSYIDDDGVKHVGVKKNEFVKMRCDSIVCPNLNQVDCYASPDTCPTNTWCMIDQHEKWGPWAMGSSPKSPIFQGKTIQAEYCTPEKKAEIDAVTNPVDKAALLKSWDDMCDVGYTANINLWKPIRGRCVNYRQEGQSCWSEPLYYSEILKPRFPRDEEGKTFGRPLLCAPGLACTGPDYYVLPNTCVKKRPQNICFLGPWWDSSVCPRQGKSSPGLTRDEALLALRTLMLVFEGEIVWTATCDFWDTSKPLGKGALRVRQQGYEIARLLWPTRLVGPIPSFNAVMQTIPNVMANGYKECVRQSKIPNSAISKQLAQIGAMSMRPNLLWSFIHLATFNLPNPVSKEQSEANRFLATWLAENFWCDDCRSFFQIGVIQEYLSLPPLSSNPNDLAVWWWKAHNMAAEHFATSRGSHPWNFQLGETGYEQYQNPFFMTWEDAMAMWKVDQ